MHLPPLTRRTDRSHIRHLGPLQPKRLVHDIDVARHRLQRAREVVQTRLLGAEDLRGHERQSRARERGSLHAHLEDLPQAFLVRDRPPRTLLISTRTLRNPLPRLDRPHTSPQLSHPRLDTLHLALDLSLQFNTQLVFLPPDPRVPSRTQGACFRYERVQPRSERNGVLACPERAEGGRERVRGRERVEVCVDLVKERLVLAVEALLEIQPRLERGEAECERRDQPA